MPKLKVKTRGTLVPVVSRPRPFSLADALQRERASWMMRIVASPEFSAIEVRILVGLALTLRPWEYGLEQSDLAQFLPVEEAFDERSPSAAQLARLAGAGIRTVRRALAKARAAGLLGVKEPGGGRGKRPVYALLRPAPEKAARSELKPDVEAVIAAVRKIQQ